MNGYWVVFEDIDKAPSDVQSILLPLLEGEITFITSHGEVTICFSLLFSYREVVFKLICSSNNVRTLKLNKYTSLFFFSKELKP